MQLLTERTGNEFDGNAIGKGDFIRAQYQTWDEPKNGIVTRVTGEQLTVLYLPGIGNVSNYFTIQASEVVDCKWSILWSSDMATIQSEVPT